MKRILALAIAALLLLGVTACGGEEEKGGDTTKTTQPAATHDISLNGVNLLIGGVLDTETKAKLGSLLSKSEAPSCMYEGMDIIYEYEGFTLQTNQQDEEEIVCIITVMDAKYPTQKNIKVGDAADAVKEIYGTPVDESDYYLVYEIADNYDLTFSLHNGQVIVIEYAMRVEN